MEAEDADELADEFAETREMLDSRYDGIVSGKVKLIDGEKAMAMYPC